jgi:hypothetical protein
MSTTSRAAPSSKLRRKGLLRSCYFRNVEALETKKCGAESSDPNRHSQPRLPGSVVGEPSMPHRLKAHKITKVSVRR